MPRKGQLSGFFVNCKNCGKEIYKTPYQYKKHKNHYCDNKCQREYQSKLVAETRVCEICGTEFTVPQSDPKRLCSVECQRIWQTQQTGILNPKFDGVLVSCDYCGVLYYTQKYKAYSDVYKHRFCGEKCRKEWYSKVWSQSDEWREESRIRAANILSRGLIPNTNTKPQQIVNSILDDLNIKYTNEKNFKYYAMDNYLDDYNLCIEVMGDYWHSSPIKYRERSELYPSQSKNIRMDKAKRTYIRKYYKIEILNLWEDDIYNKPEMISALILEYINSKGELKNYNSFNYELVDGKLIRDKIIKPYFEI